MILIYPPVAKPCEPPAGIAQLLGALDSNGVECTVLDANLEGLLSLISEEYSLVANDRWTKRALRHRFENVDALRRPRAYLKLDRYKRAVLDLNRVLEVSAASFLQSVRLSLGNYQHLNLSPTRSDDLVRAAETPDENPFYPYFKKRLSTLLEKKQPKIIGFSVNFLSQALCAFAMIGFVRRECPQTSIVMGGGLITSWMRKPGWKSPFAGLVNKFVAGPGERSILSLADVPSLDVRHYTPNYDPFPESYLAPGRIIPYSMSTGCYWSKCSFCPERAEANAYIPVSTEAAISDLASLISKTKPELIHILDNAISPKMMKAIAESPPGVPWYGFARLTTHLADPDFCVSLKKSGCIMLKLGLESGDQNVLDKEQKGIDLGVASLVLKTLKQTGIAAYVYLLFGTPSETLTEARKSLDFIVGHRDDIRFLNLAIFNLPIHGPDVQKLNARKPYDGDLSLYSDFLHPSGWHREVVRQFLDKEFRRHPAIAPILKNEPPIFTSNHAPFFCESGLHRKPE